VTEAQRCESIMRRDQSNSHRGKAETIVSQRDRDTRIVVGVLFFAATMLAYKLSATTDRRPSVVLAEEVDNDNPSVAFPVPKSTAWPPMNTRQPGWEATADQGLIDATVQTIEYPGLGNIQISGDASMGLCGSDTRIDHSIPPAIQRLCSVMHANLQPMIHLFYSQRRAPVMMHVADIQPGGITGAESGCIKLYIEGKPLIRCDAACQYFPSNTQSLRNAEKRGFIPFAGAFSC